MYKKRLEKEITDLSLLNNESIISFGPVSDDLDYQALIKGPKNSPYEGGFFFINFKYTRQYPFKPPNVTFTTKIYHQSISNNGYIKLSIVDDDWSPIVNISKILSEILYILVDPNPNNNVNYEALYHFEQDRINYYRIARDFTIKYASN